MRIDELDEHQGLEAQMVRDWLTSKGCYRQDGPWRHPTEKYSYTDGEYGGLLWEDTLFKLSVDFELASVQALLREINPRMRKGCPSNAAIQAHDGPWLELRGASRLPGVTEFGSDPDQGQREWIEDYCKDALFWPCDRYGNKVRWPTDAQGEML